MFSCSPQLCSVYWHWNTFEDNCWFAFHKSFVSREDRRSSSKVYHSVLPLIFMFTFTKILWNVIHFWSIYINNYAAFKFYNCLGYHDLTHTNTKKCGDFVPWVRKLRKTDLRITFWYSGLQGPPGAKSPRFSLLVCAKSRHLSFAIIPVKIYWE